MNLPSDFTFEKYGLQLRFVNENDAEFIVKLRTNPKLGRFIHSTSSDIELQKKWIRDYKQRESEGKDYYFIFFKGGQPVGLNRIYHIEEDRFTSGSWVFEQNAAFECSIASALIVRIIAFDILGKEIEFGVEGCHVDNKKVIKFNLMIGLKIKGTRIEENGEYYTFNLTKQDFEKNKPKIERLIGFTNI
ncbi:MAG: GNAT family N-acetyltransferase [Lentimicrobiaceae bacterium]|nr:GNAT family N-acetyltransferase [Lentimicrobiaceae bacterium]